MAEWPQTEFGSEKMAILLDKLSDETKKFTEILKKLLEIDEKQIALLEKEKQKTN